MDAILVKTWTRPQDSYFYVILHAFVPMSLNKVRVMYGMMFRYILHMILKCYEQVYYNNIIIQSLLLLIIICHTLHCNCYNINSYTDSEYAL